MTYVIVVTSSASPRLSGLLSRFLLQVESNVWAGKVPTGTAEAIIASLVKMSAGSAVLIRSQRSELGLAVQYFGPSQRSVVDNFGLPLIRKRVSSLLSGKDS